jgi:hypothetical protein
MQSEVDVDYGGHKAKKFGMQIWITGRHNAPRCRLLGGLADTVQVRWLSRAVNVRQPMAGPAF